MSGVVTRLRDPRYTGENRCSKCTVVNVGLAALLSVGVAVLNVVLGGVVFVVALLAIYFRGYLVPGTPQLTKRYFPHDLLAWFDAGKTEDPSSTDTPSIESILREAGVLLPADEDLVLDSDFRERWRKRIEEYRGDPSATADMLGRIGGLGGIDSKEVTVAETNSAFVASVDGIRVGRWESRGAYIADVAAAEELEDRYLGWDSLSFDERTEVLGGLRLWLEQCPLCDGRVSLGTETVESCCRTIAVVAGTCEACGRRMFEVEAPDGL